MVRNYIPKTTQTWTKTEMLAAVKDVIIHKETMRKTFTRYGLRRTTLVRYCKIAREEGIESVEALLNKPKKTFSEEQEYCLKQYIKDMNLSLDAISIPELCTIAYQFAEINNIKHKFNRETGKASEDWCHKFLKRHKAVDDSTPPEGFFYKELNTTFKDTQFFDLLANFQQFSKFSHNHIYEISDTCSISIPNLISKVFSSSDERVVDTKFVTALICANASGKFVPPLLVFPTNVEDPIFLNGCPRGSKMACNPSGLIENEIFYPMWFDHFVKYAKPSHEDPILLLVSNKATYVRNIEFIAKAKELGINILTVPQSKTCKLHPLEYDFMESLKLNYFEEQNNWMKESQQQFVTLQNFGQVFGPAYKKAAVAANVINGFRKSGIYPLNAQLSLNFINIPESNIVIKEETKSNPLMIHSLEIPGTTNTQNPLKDINYEKDLKNEEEGKENVTDDLKKDLSYLLYDDQDENEQYYDSSSSANIHENPETFEMVFVESMSG